MKPLITSLEFARRARWLRAWAFVAALLATAVPVAQESCFAVLASGAGSSSATSSVGSRASVQPTACCAFSASLAAPSASTPRAVKNNSDEVGKMLPPRSEPKPAVSPADDVRYRTLMAAIGGRGRTVNLLEHTRLRL